LERSHILAQLSLHRDRPAQHPHHCKSTHPPTSEQDPRLLKLLHLRKRLTPNLECIIYALLTEDHGLRLGGANSGPGCFTLSCKSPPVPAGGLCSIKQDHIVTKSKDTFLSQSNWKPSASWLCLEILSMKLMNRISDKEQASPETSLTYCQRSEQSSHCGSSGPDVPHP